MTFDKNISMRYTDTLLGTERIVKANAIME